MAAALQSCLGLAFSTGLEDADVYSSLDINRRHVSIFSKRTFQLEILRLTLKCIYRLCIATMLSNSLGEFYLDDRLMTLHPPLFKLQPMFSNCLLHK